MVQVIEKYFNYSVAINESMNDYQVGVMSWQNKILRNPMNLGLKLCKTQFAFEIGKTILIHRRQWNGSIDEK